MHSLIPMLNGSTVLRADLRTRSTGASDGFVLALTTDNQYVTWRVYRGIADDQWLASAGEYCLHGTQDENLLAATADYEERRRTP